MHLAQRTSTPIVRALFARGRTSAIVGILVTVALIWWTIRDVPVSSLLAHVQQAKLEWLAAAAALAIATILLRVPRWRSVLRQFDGVPSGALYHAAVLGLFGNSLLPARSGEIVRAYALSKLAPVPVGAALGSIALERMLDVLAIAALALLGVVVEGGSASVGSTLPIRHVAWLTGGATLVIVGTGLLLHWRPRAMQWIARSLLSPHRTRSLAGLVGRVSAGLAAARSPRLMISLLAWSFLIWGINATAFWMGFVAFNIHVPWTAAVVLQGAVALGIALPSSPGFFGPFEAATRVALAAYGVTPVAAAAFAIPFHVCVFFIPTIVLGVWSLWSTGISIRLGALATNSPTAAHGGLPAPTASTEVREWRGTWRAPSRGVTVPNLTVRQPNPRNTP